jgi:hypothetical protein
MPACARGDAIRQPDDELQALRQLIAAFPGSK